MQVSQGLREGYNNTIYTWISWTASDMVYAPKCIDEGRNLRYNSKERKAFSPRLVAQNLGRV